MTNTVPDNIKVPPNGIISAIEKTVSFVKKNGTSFEERLKSNDTDKFKFINKEDQYYPYYTWLLSNDIKAESTTSSNIYPVSKNEEKPSDLNFLLELPTVSPLDLDIIKMTSLYVAQNGESYISHIFSYAKKTNNEAQFEFLNKSHSLHSLFRQCINQYELLIKFYKHEDSERIRELTEKLHNSDDIFSRAYARSKYNKSHKTIALNEKKMKKEQQLHYASISWQDYSIVRKVEFDAVDQVQELAVPISRDDLIHRSLQSKREEINFQNEMPKDVQKEDLDKTTTNTDIPKGIKIKSAGETRLKSKKKVTIGESNIKCPITGQLIPESKFDEHLRILLRDPKYKDQQDNYLKKNFKYASNLTTDEVYENIKRLARKRDGSSEDPLDNRKKRSIGPSI